MSSILMVAGEGLPFIKSTLLISYPSNSQI